MALLVLHFSHFPVNQEAWAYKTREDSGKQRPQSGFRIPDSQGFNRQVLWLAVNAKEHR